MDDIIAVGERQGGRHFNTNFGGFRGADLTHVGEGFGQCATRDIFHSHEICVVTATPVVDADDVWMIEVSSGLCFASKPFNKCGIGGELGEKNFDGDKTIKQDVAGQINIGHTTAPDALLHLIAIVHND